MQEWVRRAGGGILAASVLLSCGCSSLYPPLPHIGKSYVIERMQPIPPGAAPLLSWHGERPGVRSYWGIQHIVVRATAWFPDEWKQPGDEVWRVQAQNHEGKPIHFIGVERRVVGEGGREAALLIPPIDLKEVPDGLYLAMALNAETNEGKLARVRPTANICEIRKGMFMPFRVRIPLIPDQVSPLTPMPELVAEPPAGTPMPTD